MSTEQQTQGFVDLFDRMVANVEQVLRGKTEIVRLAWICLLAEGHLLIEDIPGTGKTTLARALAQSIQGKWRRIQFTPDLLPSDVTGVTIYDQGTRQFDFHEGPVFATIVLADEINRASPKTQAALLEVMEESQVTVDGTPHPVGPPFMVIATQNPVEQGGTYPLPEAQLDRFLMRTSLGHPDAATSVALLSHTRVKADTVSLEPVVSLEDVSSMVATASQVTASPKVLGYLVALAEATRRAEEVRLGVSMRGCIALTRACRARAASQGRTYITPDDVKELAVPVWSHRLLLTPDSEYSGRTGTDVIVRTLSQIPPPSGR